MTVQETMRAFGVPPQSRIWRTLAAAKGPLSAAAAVSCLGRGVHTGVARQVVQMLVARGDLKPGAKYGSAFSGIDTFASALEAELTEETGPTGSRAKKRRPCAAGCCTRGRPTA